ncbi:MAG TPA: OmpA family protein [Candidatus Angelobacter sp.]|jgi:outer membrane protein OmpA-like peptidoglycan-associated protein
MAVSQFLRPGSLLESVQGYLTPGVIHSASSLVGESESSTRQTMNGAVAGVLSGVTHMVSSREGAGNLTNMIREGGFGGALDNVGSFLGGGSATTGLLNTGQQLLGRIFGNNASSVAESVGKFGGVRASSATKLMSMAAPLVMGVLGKRIATQKLDSSGLANLLLSEKSDIAAATPAGVSQLLSAGPSMVSSSRTVTREADVSSPTHLEHFVERAPALDRPTAPPPGKTGMRWLPLALAALIALGLLWALRGRMSRANVGDVTSRAVNTARQGLEQITLPGGGSISVAPGSINYDLAKFLGDPSAQVPKNFVFDNLNFEAATTQLTPDSQPTVNNLASVLKAYPNAKVQLVGYTDNTGNPDANQTLSQNRADAVKSILVNQGVSADRITTQGQGQNNPVASNDTEEGRLRNRRTELVVNNK